MRTEDESPGVNIVLGLAMLAGVALMATQLWSAAEYSLDPHAQESAASGFTPESHGSLIGTMAGGAQ